MRNILQLFISILIFINCMDDKGNYEYKDSRIVTISKPNAENYYNLEFNEFLILDSEFTSDISESDLEYAWQVYKRFNYFDDRFVDISNEKSLNYHLTLNDYFYAAGIYDMRFKITQVSTGLEFYSDIFKVNISPEETPKGLLVLHGDDNECDVDLVKASPFLINENEGTEIETIYFRNYYSKENNEKIPGKGIEVFQAMTDYTFNYNYKINVLTDREARICEFSSFSKIGEFEDLFMSDVPLLKEPRFFNWSGMLFFVTDGNLYSKSMQYDVGSYPFMYTMHDYKVSPYVCNVNSKLVWFDVDDKCFGVTTGMSTDPRGGNSLKLEVKGDPVFNLSDMQADLLFMDTGGQGDYYILGVFKDYSGKLFLAELDFYKREADDIPVQKYDMEVLSDISNAKFHAFGEGFINMNYYATNTDIYIYTVEKSINPLTSKLLTDIYGNPIHVGAGEEITMFKLMKQNNSKGFDNYPVVTYAYRNKMLIVGTYDGIQGRLYAFEIDQASGLVKKQTIFDGFEKIYDANLKGY